MAAEFVRAWRVSWLAIICLALEHCSFFIHIVACTGFFFFFLMGPNKDFRRSIEKLIAKFYKNNTSSGTNQIWQYPFLAPTLHHPPTNSGLYSVLYDSLSSSFLRNSEVVDQASCLLLCYFCPQLLLEWRVPGTCWQKSLVYCPELSCVRYPRQAMAESLCN